MAGELDHLFAVTGKIVDRAAPPGRDIASAVAVGGDGGVYVAGLTAGDVFAAQWDDTGRRESGFGRGGGIRHSLSALTGRVSFPRMASGPGHIMLVGTLTDSVFAGLEVLLIGYDQIGLPNRTFGAEGVVTVPVPSGHDPDPDPDPRADVAIQPDGKVVVAASVLGVARLLAGGALDPSFGAGGVASIGPVCARALAIQPDGRILVAGSADGGTRIAVVRCDPHGRLEASVVLPPVGATGDHVNGLAVQSDGKVVVGGWCEGTDHRAFLLLRCHPDGSPDHAFGDQGVVTTRVTEDCHVNAIGLQPDGKVVACGTATGAGGRVVTLARYLPNGALDAGFGQGGVSSIPFGGSSDGLAMAIQSDGAIVVAGHTTGEQQRGTLALARVVG